MHEMTAEELVGILTRMERSMREIKDMLRIVAAAVAGDKEGALKELEQTGWQL